jgi:hypothetical protein
LINAGLRSSAILTDYAEKHAKKKESEAAKKRFRVPKRRLDASLYSKESAQPAEDVQKHFDEMKDAEVKRLKVAFLFT